MKTFGLLLLVLIFTEQIAGASAATKNYTIDCTSKSVALVTVNQGYQLSSSKNGCPLPPTNLVYNISGACYDPTSTFTVSKLPLPPLNQKLNISGGKDGQTFIIDCAGAVPGSGVTVTAKADLKVSTSPGIETHAAISLSMMISKDSPGTTGVKQLKPLGTANIGDKLFLVIQSDETNEAAAMLIPENCTAEDSNGQQTVLLWDTATCAKQPTLLEPFKVNHTLATTKLDISYAPIYAFKFTNGESVSYRCTVLVCPRKGGTGACHDDLSKCPMTRRRRSSMDTYVDSAANAHVRRTVSVSLEVADFQGISSGNDLKMSMPLALMSMVTCLLLRRAEGLSL